MSHSVFGPSLDAHQVEEGVAIVAAPYLYVQLYRALIKKIKLETYLIITFNLWDAYETGGRTRNERSLDEGLCSL